jgi:nitroreductase
MEKSLATPGLEAHGTRAPEADVDPLFVRRWSPRSFLPDPIDGATLRSLLEAARWAPSASNLQPWLFVYADDEELLARVRPIVRDGNRRWADRAPLLIFAFARRLHPQTGEPNRLAAFDAGAAWMSVALQATRLGLRAHAMGGVHHDRAHALLEVPEQEFEFLCGIAVGRQGPGEALPDDLRAREHASDRQPTTAFAHRGRYRTK